MKTGSNQTVRKARLIKLELNDYGDYVVVSPDDSVLFERFAAGSKQIANMANRVGRKLKKIDRKYKGRTNTDSVCNMIVESTEIRTQFSKDAIKIFDGIFGEGTIRKYFRKFYEEDPDFLPTEIYFTDFLDQITPAMKQLQSMR